MTTSHHPFPFFKICYIQKKQNVKFGFLIPTHFGTGEHATDELDAQDHTLGNHRITRLKRSQGSASAKLLNRKHPQGHMQEKKICGSE